MRPFERHRVSAEQHALCHLGTVTRIDTHNGSLRDTRIQSSAKHLSATKPSAVRFTSGAARCSDGNRVE
eukprot:scaffold2136_cov242-Pinguiococcus_pyrenoidosus.AAC.18